VTNSFDLTRETCRGVSRGLVIRVCGTNMRLPLAVFTVVFAQRLVVALFGGRRRPASGAMQGLSLWALLTTMSTIWGNMFKAYARPDIVLKLEIPQAVALIAGSLLLVNAGSSRFRGFRQGSLLPPK